MFSLHSLLPDKMDADRDEKGQLYYIYTRNSDENSIFAEHGRVYLQPEDAQFPGTGKFQINEIARLYRIPPHMEGCQQMITGRWRT